MPMRNGSTLTARAISRTVTNIGNPGASFPRSSGVQPGELVLAVQLDAGRAPDLAAGRGGKRPGWDHNEVCDIQAVRVGYRGGDLALDSAEPARLHLVRISPLL